MSRAEQISSLMIELVSNDAFFQELLEDGTIELKSADHRKSFKINLLDKPIGPLGKTFRDWIDENRLPNSTGYERAIIWFDHNKELTTGSLRFTGRLLRDHVSHPFLEEGNTNHHRTQFCYLIFWSKLQLMTDAEIEDIISAWIPYIKSFFRVK